MNRFFPFPLKLCITGSVLFSIIFCVTKRKEQFLTDYRTCIYTKLKRHPHRYSKSALTKVLDYRCLSVRALFVSKQVSQFLNEYRNNHGKTCKRIKSLAIPKRRVILVFSFKRLQIASH